MLSHLPQFLDNLKYFVKEAVERDPGVCDYVIAVQRSHGQLDVGDQGLLLAHDMYA
jgi:hypothetical protein